MLKTNKINKNFGNILNPPPLSEESRRTHTKNLSEESFPTNFMEYQINNIPSYYSEPPFFNQNPNNQNNQNRNYYSHHQHSKPHHYHHNNIEKSNLEARENPANFFPENNQNPSNSFIANSMGTPTHRKNSKKSHKNSKRKDKKYGEKELQMLLNNEKMQAHSNFAFISQQNKEKIESSNINGLSHNLSHPPNNFNKAGPGSFSQQQQMYNMMTMDKDLSNSGRRCNIPPPPPQMYQPPPLRANGYFYGNNSGNNNFMNGNMSQTNLYCYPGNNNPFIGVNYPNVPNIAFAKPNNYSSFAVVDIGPEANNPQFGINYLPERSYTEKVRNNNEYWKPPYYSYNNQS